MEMEMEMERRLSDAASSCGDADALLEQCSHHSCAVKGSEEDLDLDSDSDLGGGHQHLVEDFDSYMEDINNRFTISRMVNNSVTKGMVKAVEQEATTRIAMKEFEVNQLKDAIRLYIASGDELETTSEGYLFKHRLFNNGVTALLNQNTKIGSFGKAVDEVKNHVKKLKIEMDNTRGSDSVNERLNSLEYSLDKLYKHAECAAQLSEVSFDDEWRQEQVFQEEIQDMVIKNSFRGLQQEFEEHLWNLNAQFCGSEDLKWAERMDEISKLRQELNSIHMSLSMPETEQLISHGSLDFEERNYSRKTGQSNGKALSSHLSSSNMLSEENGKHDLKSIVPERPGSQQFISHSNMTKDELINCLKSELAQMKRDHESDMHKRTEQYYSLKREYLKSEYFKEKGHLLSLKRDKESERLRKKIPDVILKLDNILVNTEKLSASSNMVSLKDRLINLLSENRQLRDFLEDKKKENKSLSTQVSDAADKMLKHSFTEANLLKMISKLKGDIEDIQIEALITVEVSKCVLGEGISLIKLNSRESHMLTQHNAKTASKCEIQDSDIESIVMEGLLGIVCREAFKDADTKLSNLYAMYTNEKNSLQIKLMDNEKRLTLEAEEKEMFKQEVLLLKANIEEKEKFFLEAMAKEKERFELVNQEINRLRDHRNQQQSLLSKSNSELDSIKCELVEAVKQINMFKVETNDLNQKLESARNDLMDANEERRVLLAATQDRQRNVLVTEAQEKHKDTIILYVHKFIKEVADFEFRVAEDVKNKSSRVETANSLIQNLRRTTLQYKRKLEKRCVDLRKAETEVDLLGDEVDTLLSLMEKIYIALDHYSPILQHYPGIMEILKLVRRELSGEFLKLN